MKLKLFFWGENFFILGLVFVSGASAQYEGNWKKIENKSFSFSIPADFKKTAARGIDSFVEEYVSDSIKLSFDYGIYSNNFEGWPEDTKFEHVTVDGKAARIGIATKEFHKGYPYSVQIHIKLNSDIALSMFAACKTEKEVIIVRKIFETITFKTRTV